MFVRSSPTNDATSASASPDKMIHQTRQLMEETVKLSDLTHRLFWVTVVLGAFAVIRYLSMVLDFCDHP
ncbi:MAG: hypothetical protein WDN00_09025 [Limisphaerales bacterium]